MYSNPITEKPSNFILYIAFWIFTALVYFIVLITFENLDPFKAAIDSLVFNLLIAGFGLGVWYAVRYISFETHSIYKILVAHSIGGIIFTTLWLAIGYYIVTMIIPYDKYYYSLMSRSLPWSFLLGILFYFLLTSFYYLMIYYAGLQEKINREGELKNLIIESELKSLKFQINPHFIFNSLNSMSALTTIDPGKAREMILKLADFLRYTLANNEKQNNPLRDELNNIKLYLDIEKIRFDDKFEFIEEVKERCLNTPVPNMILQPLFENAIKHAVYETLDKVTIKLTCSGENGFLKITLENNFEPGTIKRPGTGVGLQNIKNRLKLIYDRDNLIDIKKTDNLFKVTLYIPVEEN